MTAANGLDGQSRQLEHIVSDFLRNVKSA
jgi:hypothetical protein